MIFTNRKVCFHFYYPPKSDIVVFDETNIHYITRYILNDVPYFIYNMAIENIYFTPKIFMNFIKSVKLINLKNLKKRKCKIRAILRELLCHYRLSSFQYISPKIVITFIDNSGDFHWLCKNYKYAEFFAIQNGNRNPDRSDERNPDRKLKYFINHYFCFGDYDKELFMKNGHSIDNYYPIGSLLAGYYNLNDKSNNEIKYDIGIVSTFRKKEIIRARKSRWTSNYWESIDVLHTFLEKYIAEYKLQAAVFMNCDRSDISKYKEEKEYFTEIYDNNIDILDTVRERFSTYHGVDNSDVIIGFRSTVLREAFGWGKKILSCNFTGADLYSEYDSLIMFTEPNYESFKRRLNKLRDEPYEEYTIRTKGYASYLMNNNQDFPPHIYIRKKIEEYL